MRFIVMVKASPESEAGVLPTADMLDEMTKFNEEMVKAGVMLAGEGLQPTAKGARIDWKGGKTTVTDGPFAETKELVAGFWIIQVKSLADAVAWISRAPFEDNARVEIRQVFEASDFGENLTDEVRERNERMAREIASRS